MQYRYLGDTQEKVSLICLGTMTWGEQNTETEAHQQMDYALERGINFLIRPSSIRSLPKKRLKEKQKSTSVLGLKKES